MNKEYQEQLFAVEPSWFVRDDMSRSNMFFGFEVGDGWFTLLMALLLEIQKANPPENFEVVQVKEKFGGLRFYVENSNETIRELIRNAELLSYETCEWCGKPGNEDTRYPWQLTLCESCKAERKRKREETSDGI